MKLCKDHLPKCRLPFHCVVPMGVCKASNGSVFSFSLYSYKRNRPFRAFLYPRQWAAILSFFLGFPQGNPRKKERRAAQGGKKLRSKIYSASWFRVVLCLRLATFSDIFQLQNPEGPSHRELHRIAAMLARGRHR